MCHRLTSVLFIHGRDNQRIPFIRPPKTPLVSKSIQRMKEQSKIGVFARKSRRSVHGTVEKEYRPLDVFIKTQPASVAQRRRLYVRGQNKIAAKTGELQQFPEDIEDFFHQGLLSKPNSIDESKHEVTGSTVRAYPNNCQQQQQDSEGAINDDTTKHYRAGNKTFQCLQSGINKGRGKTAINRRTFNGTKLGNVIIPEVSSRLVEEHNPRNSLYPRGRQVGDPVSGPETPHTCGVNSTHGHLQGSETTLPVYQRETCPLLPKTTEKTFRVPEIPFIQQCAMIRSPRQCNSVGNLFKCNYQKTLAVPTDTPLIQQCAILKSPNLGSSDGSFAEDAGYGTTEWLWQRKHAQVVPETPLLMQHGDTP